MHFIQSLSQAVSDGQYNIIATDVYGVLHDGVKPYPYTRECLKELDTRNFQTFLLSNSSRLGHILAKDLQRKFGIDETTYKRVISSGDLTKLFLNACVDQIRGLARNSDHCVATMLVNGESHAVTAEHFVTKFIRTGHFYLVGNEAYHAPLYEHLSPHMARVPFNSDIDFVLVGMVVELPDQRTPMDPNDPDSVKTHYTKFLHQCLANDLPFIVANPDVRAPNGTNPDGYPRLLVCPGYIGQLYHEMGGKVLYFGKPFTTIYQYLLAIVKSPKSQLLCIGDNVSTDVLGAKKMGLDVVLILDGVHGLSMRDNQCVSRIQNLCLQNQSPEPTFVLQQLRF
ncbi:HAD-like domain-containing protein [Fennellomyces sp. T-0311]|nr:HAD-like domain-containing protein [Fennellomyces sp. T-0311]